MRKVRPFIMVAAMLSLTGCVAAVVGGTAVATKTAHDRRMVGTQIDDAAITAKIGARLIAEKDMPSRWVSVQVIDGDATLTGYLPTQNHIDRAVHIAHSIKGVCSVRSELLIGKPKISSLVKDSIITTKVKTALLSDTQVSGFSVKVETVDGKVYLQGVVDNFVQRQRAIDITKKIDGVTAVVDLMQIEQK